MSGKQRYSAYVDTEEISSPLECTRVLRLALNVLRNDLPPGTDTEPVHDALTSIHDRITAIETDEHACSGQRSTTLSSGPSTP